MWNGLRQWLSSNPPSKVQNAADMDESKPETAWFRIGESQMALKITADREILSSLSYLNRQLPPPPRLFMVSEDYKTWLSSLMQPKISNDFCLVVERWRNSKRPELAPKQVIRDLSEELTRLKPQLQHDYQMTNRLEDISIRLSMLSGADLTQKHLRELLSLQLALNSWCESPTDSALLLDSHKRKLTEIYDEVTE